MLQPELEAAPPELRAREQRRRLATLVERLRASASPFWRAKLAGVEPVSTLGDLARLPFTVKAELRETYPFGMLALPRERTVRVHGSSGTRGKPTIVAYTAGDVALFAEVNARAIACAGGRPGDVLHVAYGYGLFTGGLGLHYGGERLGATVVPMSGGNAAFQVQMLADLGADGLACTPSFAMLLAERARAEGLAERLRLRYGVLGAEPWSDAFRAKIEHAFGGGFEACDIYGLSEVIGPGVAAECVEGKGAMHVFDDHFLPEVLDTEGRPVTAGRPGELVLTTLTKEALPVLRYRTGDVTRLVEGACPCGRTHPRIGRIEGRVDDMLVVRGVNVFPREVEAVLLDEPSLAAHYVLVVDRRRTMAELEVRAELHEPLSNERAEQLAQTLRVRLERRLLLRVGVSVGQPGTLPRQEGGKARRVVERTDDGDPLRG